jgi:hypothetical protein
MPVKLETACTRCSRKCNSIFPEEEEEEGNVGGGGEGEGKGKGK